MIAPCKCAWAKAAVIGLAGCCFVHLHCCTMVLIRWDPSNGCSCDMGKSLWELCSCQVCTELYPNCCCCCCCSSLPAGGRGQEVRAAASALAQLQREACERESAAHAAGAAQAAAEVASLKHSLKAAQEEAVQGGAAHALLAAEAGQLREELDALKVRNKTTRTLKQTRLSNTTD